MMTLKESDEEEEEKAEMELTKKEENVKVFICKNNVIKGDVSKKKSWWNGPRLNWLIEPELKVNQEK